MGAVRIVRWDRGDTHTLKSIGEVSEIEQARYFGIRRQGWNVRAVAPAR